MPVVFSPLVIEILGLRECYAEDNSQLSVKWRKRVLDSSKSHNRTERDSPSQAFGIS